MLSSNLAFILFSKQWFTINGLDFNVIFDQSADLSALNNAGSKKLNSFTFTLPDSTWTVPNWSDITRPGSDLRFCLPTQHYPALYFCQFCLQCRCLVVWTTIHGDEEENNVVEVHPKCKTESELNCLWPQSGPNLTYIVFLFASHGLFCLFLIVIYNTFLSKKQTQPWF